MGFWCPKCGKQDAEWKGSFWVDIHAGVQIVDINIQYGIMKRIIGALPNKPKKNIALNKFILMLKIFKQ